MPSIIFHTENVRCSLYVARRKWFVRFSYDRRQHFKPVADTGTHSAEEARTEAEKIVRRIVQQIDRANDHRNPKQNPLVLYDRRVSGKSAALIGNHMRYKERLVEFFGERDMLTITRLDVIAWRDWLSKQPKRGSHKGHGVLSPKSVKEHLDWLAAVYNHSGLQNPCRGVERPKISKRERQEKIQFFTRDEMDLLFEAVKNTPYENAFTFLAYTGCRQAEMQGIKPEDMDETTRIVYVIGKNDTRRPLKLTGPCVPAWNALVNQLPKAVDGFLFPQGESWSRDWMDNIGVKVWGASPESLERHKAVTDKRNEIRRLKRKERRKIPVPSHRLRPCRPCHPHMLRHTFASMALLYWRPQWEIQTLAKWLGHEDINTTFREYSHWIAAEAPSAWGSEEVQPKNNLRTLASGE